MATNGDEGYDFNDICVGNVLFNGAVGEHIWAGEDRHSGLLHLLPGRGGVGGGVSPSS